MSIWNRRGALIANIKDWSERGLIDASLADTLPRDVNSRKQTRSFQSILILLVDCII